MDNTAKTLEEMNAVERFHLAERVSDALRDAAHQAEDQGDVRFAANSRSVAAAILGCAGDPDGDYLDAAELLLKQGVMLLHLYSDRKKAPRMLH